jgi:hypothetical protein
MGQASDGCKWPAKKTSAATNVARSARAAKSIPGIAPRESQVLPATVHPAVFNPPPLLSNGMAMRCGSIPGPATGTPWHVMEMFSGAIVYFGFRTILRACSSLGIRSQLTLPRLVANERKGNVNIDLM